MSSGTVLNQTALLAAVNQATYPDGRDAYASDTMGGIERDANGKIVAATAVRVDFILAADWDAWRGSVARLWIPDPSGRVGVRC